MKWPLPDPVLPIAMLALVACSIDSTDRIAEASQALYEGDAGSVQVEVVETSGNWFSFARMSDGTVYGWGNNFGQLGDATNIRRHIPVKVRACRDDAGSFISATSESDCESLGGTLSELTGAIDLNTGQNHTLALLDGGTPGHVSDDVVVAWGLGGLGQLGDGNDSFSRTAVQVACGEMAGTPFCSPEGALQGVTAIATGGGAGGSAGHSLALLSDGSLVAWGWNQFGQLGNGEAGTTASTPVRVTCGEVGGDHCEGGLLAGVAAIEGSIASSYAILSNGTMASWGLNGGGWLGDGTTSTRVTPVFVTCGELEGTDFCSAEGHLTGVVELAEDPTSLVTLVILSDGTAAAWGANFFGQIGDGTTVDSPSPVRVRGFDGTGLLSGVTALASGTIYSLALLSDGTVAAWGNNYAGQVGDGTTALRTLPTPVLGLTGVVDIGAGYDHSHALLADGTLIGWGNNNTSQLGLEAAGGISTPVHVVRSGSPLTEVSALAGGGSFSLALHSDETVLSWGSNDSGQLGDGTTNGRNTAGEVSGLSAGSGTVAIAAGFGFSLALGLDGGVVAWGANGAGQLGDGTTTPSALPVAVTGLGAGSGVTAIAVHPTSSHALALRSDGTVVAWGANDFGELGDGTIEQRHAPVPVRCGDQTPAEYCAGGELGGVAAIASGHFHSLALTSDGTVLEWGGGVTTTPQQVSGLVDVVAIGSRANLSMAILSDHTVVQWGVGQSPRAVPGLSDVTAVVGGDTFSLALRSDGTVLAWGSNSLGQLGDGTTRGTGTPVPVMTCRDGDGELIATLINTSCAALGGSLTELTDVAAIGAGYNHALAALDDGTTLAWGSRGGGKLGDGSPGAFFAEPSVIMALGSIEPAIKPASGRALIVGTDSMVERKIQGDFTNLVVIGSGATVQRKIKWVGVLILDGSAIGLDDDVRVDNLRVTANGSATIWGDLDFTSSVVLEEGATLTVVGDVTCGLEAGVSRDPTATLDAQDGVRCSVLETD